MTISIEQYLEKVAEFAGSDYGQIVRSRFKDIQGASELAMLAAPTRRELEQLQKAVAIMTEYEKKNAGNLPDEKLQQIAADAGIEAGNLAIFLNGYELHCKRVS